MNDNIDGGRERLGKGAPVDVHRTNVGEQVRDPIRVRGGAHQDRYVVSTRDECSQKVAAEESRCTGQEKSWSHPRDSFVSRWPCALGWR